ncbi:MarR family transcriptional regulator [Corynebacterium sp. YIM 101645]|uniref:MarR family transcriptional regulator n=1 Tax=Corynebacterium lemuris TaxID=1859292 RepID=A0ABT2G1G3_9CORY|nr:MarR family transcriptional regulator [Corynebacterium lemuris]
MHTTKNLSAMVADVVAEHGFTLDEWMVLDAIRRNDGSAMSQISTASGCAGASLTRAVDKLVTGSLVYREASQVDRRKVEVFISDRGRDAHQELREQLRDLDERVEKMTSVSGISREALVELCGALRGI